MAKSRIRTIIFDIGRVLVRVDIRQAQVGLVKNLSLAPEELWTAIEKDPRWRDWQEGRMPARNWHLNLSQRLGLKLSFDEFTTAWNSALDPEPLHPDRFFAALAKSHKLGLLSNTDPIHVAHLEETYSFFQYFPKEVRTYSCSVGACKPEAVVYQQALKACKARAQEALYIDDITEYVEAARALGLSGIHYRSPEQLCEELTKLGIEFT